MSGQFFLGAYWPARRESIEQCADRLRRCLVGLAACDPSLARWYETARTRKQALEKRADIDSRKYLVNLLNRGQNRRDIGRTVIKELGFQVALWNGAGDNNAASLGVICGLFWISPHPDASMGNCFTLDLPESLGELEHKERMAAVLGVVARAWEPDWAGVMSKDAMVARNFDARIPFIDWMLYLSKKMAPQIPRLEGPASVRQVEELGSIVIVQDCPPDAANSEHVQNVNRIIDHVL